MEYSRGYETDQQPRTMLEYIKTSDGYDVERLREIQTTIRELLTWDGEGNIVGLADKSCLEHNDLGHLGFIVESTSKDILELDEIPLDETTLLEDVIYDDVRVARLMARNMEKGTTTEEQAVALRATIMLAATDLLIVRERTEIDSDEDCA